MVTAAEKCIRLRLCVFVDLVAKKVVHLLLQVSAVQVVVGASAIGRIRGEVVIMLVIV